MPNKNEKQETKKTKRKILPFFVLFIILVLMGGILIGYKIYRDKMPSEKKVVAKVGEEKIYQSELDDAIYSLNYNDESLERFGDRADEVKKALLYQLIEGKILEIKAKNLGITVSDEEILAEARKSLRDFDKYDERRKEIVKDQAKFSLLQKRIADKVVNWREGKFILVRGDLHFNFEPTGLSKEQRAKLVLQDIKYAKELAGSIYNDIKSGKITFEQGMEIANNDPKVGRPAWKGWEMTFSRSFTKADSIRRPFPTGTVNFWDEIFKIKIGEISKPIPIKVIVPEDNIVSKGKTEVEALYLIAKIEKGNLGESNSYQEFIEKQKKELGVKIY